MAPKKSRKKSPKAPVMVGVFDIEVMTEQELKQYIKALKDETERMRIQLLEYQSSSVELPNHLRNVEEEIKNKQEQLIETFTDVQDHLREFNCRLKEEEKRILLEEMNIRDKNARFELESFKKLQMAQISLTDDNTKLKRLLEDSKREINHSQLDYKFVTTDMSEKQHQDSAYSIANHYKTMAAIADDFVFKYRKNTKNFYTEKMDKMVNVWKLFSNAEEPQNSISKYAEEMSFYFREILWKNMEVTTELKIKVRELEKELKLLKFYIQDAMKENKAFQAMPYKKILEEQANSEDNKLPSRNENDNLTDSKEINTNLKHANINDLIYENDVLTEKLRQVTNERNDLRQKFLSALEKIREKADFKSYLLERILSSLHNKMENSEEVSPTTYYALCPKRNRNNKVLSSNSSSNSDVVEVVIENPYEATRTSLNIFLGISQ